MFSQKVEEDIENLPEERTVDKKEEKQAARPDKTKQKKEKKIKPGEEEKKLEIKKETIQEIKQEVQEQKKEEIIEEKRVEEKKSFFDKLFGRGEEQKEVIKEPETKGEKKGFFSSIKEKIVTTKISEEKFNELFWELELGLLENNVAVEAIEKIKDDLKQGLVEKPIKRGAVEEAISQSLKKSITSLFDQPQIDLLTQVKKKKPFVICLVGINGSGKTTTIAKLVYHFQQQKLSCVIAAADTFRAAAIQQLEEHGKNLNVKVIKQDYGSDAAAVAFDTIKHAEAKKIDVVLIDTAGRLHSNKDLIREMEKIVRVAKPDLKIFVGESITGNDCVEQAREFNQAINLDGIILSKADIDEKGGAAISVSYITKKPILFLGIGQEYKDLEPFEKEKLIASLGL
ncbi:signal recognition particle-docking protein FtsY [Candidatus Woesearchaeota archaeon]|nr:signal recognition particle-docking protein FtsY [Candidatus Woesearchaeota archaeon]